jgi:hypothetical protein
MALNKAQLQALIEKDCTQQGAVSVPGPVLKELVDSYIESVATAAAADAADKLFLLVQVLIGEAVAAVITEQDAIEDLVTESATASEIATAVNSILAALRANGILATE